MSRLQILARSAVPIVAGCVATAIPAVAFAQEAPVPSTQPANDVEALRAELAQARAQITAQNEQLAEQKRRLDLFEQRLAGLAQTTDHVRDQVAAVVPQQSTSSGSSAGSGRPSVAQVGEPPKDSDRAPTVAVLDQQGSVVTRKGQLVAEAGLDYTRADRTRAVFRGVAVVQSVLIGIFDINESRQDILTGSASLRYGLSDRIEIGAKIPWIYRSDKLIAVPVAKQDQEASAVASIDEANNGSALGDIELSARYQLNKGGYNKPFLIAGLQATIPTGRDPFEVLRDDLGKARQVATGSGFWSISPTLTAILPSEPAVLFGTVGYTATLPGNVKTNLPGLQIDRVDPGDQLNFTAGIGLAINDRTSFNFGYAHTWGFGSTTTIRRWKEAKIAGVIPLPSELADPEKLHTRNLQMGRLLLGVSHRFSDKFQVNWTIEAGVTEDSPDVRTSLRIPFYF